ncbi:MAG: Holliday junction branch migration protein RuvA [Bacteroides sp.]|nr:Holliday junction branch migration protein RuvA [Bacteroides sp.]
MIDYISGEIAELTPTVAVIDNGGIGYEINITIPDYSDLQNSKRTKLYVHEAIREDAHQLYGFTTRHSRELFRLLIGVSGVGANTARLILSAIPAPQLENAIAGGDEKLLKGVKGVGARTAQRIIVDLRDKIKVEGDAFIPSIPDLSGASEDAVAALIMLGFQPQQTRKVLKKLFTDNPALTTEEAIKQALRLL